MSIMKEPYLKTINGESLTGEGNIQITGLPNPAYAQEGDLIQLKSGVWTPVEFDELGINLIVDFEIIGESVDDALPLSANKALEEIYIAVLNGQNVIGRIVTEEISAYFNISTIKIGETLNYSQCVFSNTELISISTLRIFSIYFSSNGDFGDPENWFATTALIDIGGE